MPPQPRAVAEVPSMTVSGPAVPLATGASFTDATINDEDALAVLNAVDPDVVSPAPPAVPLVWSHARKVRPVASVPFPSASGTNRTRACRSDGSSSADVALTVLIGVQLLPPSREYA